MNDTPATTELPIWAGLPPVPEPAPRPRSHLSTVVLVLAYLVLLGVVAVVAREVAWRL